MELKLIERIELTPKTGGSWAKNTDAKQSGALGDSEKFQVVENKPFWITDYEIAQGGHLKATLWGEPHPSLGETVYIHPDGFDSDLPQIAVCVRDTYVKKRPEPSSSLSDSEKLLVFPGMLLEVTVPSPDIVNKHLKVFSEGQELYLFTGDIAPGRDNESHWDFLGSDPKNKPMDKPALKVAATPKDRGKALTFPGFDGLYYTNDKIVSGGNFTWGEATHGGSRIPVDSGVVYGMIRVAEVMEDVRDKFGGRPITVNSWYRDPVTNARVGGASMSRHLVGDAIDFVVSGVHPYDVNAELDGWWGSKGGLASASCFTHIDVRGYRSRWQYGF